MSKCKKVKNPCKLCLQPVTQKNGLQCQGECQSWMHYVCLHYTPGKVKDIKAGVIQITCPCPDCTSTYVREYRTDEPFSCTNMECPANKPPICPDLECPSNLMPSMHDTNKRAMPPLKQCGYSCKQSSGAPSANASPMRSPDASASPSSGDVGGGSGGLALQAVEQMCNTVGQLSMQLNDLMKTMKNVNQDRGGARAPARQSPCMQKGPKSQCPKPCYCPGNPGRRK